MTSRGANSLDWDENGRIIDTLSSSLTYNWDSKVQSATAGTTTLDIVYDPMGNRIQRDVTVSSTTTSRKYIVDEQSNLPVILMEIDPDETDPNDAVIKTYLYANSLILAQHDGFYGDPIYFYMHDRLGSVREVIDSDGDVINCHTYQPFGAPFATEVTENVKNSWTFTGQWYDSEISQYFLRARMYDPALYRFTTRDPYTGSFGSPLQLHRYIYCLNDPMNRIDPDGRFSLSEQLTTQSAGNTISHATGAYDTAQSIYDFAQQVANATSLQNLLLTTVVNVACDKIGGWGGDFLVGKGTKILNKFKFADKIGIGSYKSVKKGIKNLDIDEALESHHLIEKRFAKTLGISADDIPSIALTKKEHQAFTNAWRDAIGYSKDMNNPLRTDMAKFDDIINAIIKVY